MASSTAGLSSRRTPTPPVAGAPVVQLSEVLSGLSYALDLTEGQREGHSVRSCLIGMRIAQVIGLDEPERASLFNALLLKDLGCSSNAARFAAIFGNNDHDLKNTLKTVNWSRASESFRFVTRNVKPGAFWLSRVWRAVAVFARGPKGAAEVVRTRCERGAEIAKGLGFSEATVSAIRSIDEHWDGRGQPYGIKGHDIPAFGRIVGLAQTFEVFNSSHDLRTAFDMAATRRGRWFEPALVDALASLKNDHAFWESLAHGDLQAQVTAAQPRTRLLVVDDDRLDEITEAFAQVIDAKSPWTYQHSNGVADLAVRLGGRLGISGNDLRELRRAALLHDLGKLGVSNLILDKPGKLSVEELHAMRHHPAHTFEILDRVNCFRPLAGIAAAHHERLDGRGYHRGVQGELIPLQSRILAVADICDALRASRPYRPGLPVERVLEIMGRDAGPALDVDCFNALRDVLQSLRVSAGDDEVPALQLVKALLEDYVQAA